MEDGDEYLSEYTNEPQLSSFEYSCFDSQDVECDRLDKALIAEQEKCFSRMWAEFQRAATSVTNLYRETEFNSRSWRTFQEAAENVTSMYSTFKGIIPCLTNTALQCGAANRNREILKLMRKYPRRLKREDMVALLSNRQPKRCHRRKSPRLPENGDSLQPFCDALNMAGLDMGMSDVALSSPSPSPVEGNHHRNGQYSQIMERLGKRHLSSPNELASKRSRHV